MDAEEIRKLRTEILHYSQQELAEMLGTDKGTVSRWERNEHIPRPFRIRQLLRLMRKGNNE